jgi:hypothetical protein
MLALLIALLVSPLTFGASYALAQDPPATQLSPEEEKQLDRQRAEVEASSLPRVEVNDVEKLVRFWVDEDGRLAAQTTITPMDGEVRVAAPRLAGIARIRVHDLQAVGDTSVGRNFHLMYQDYTQPGSQIAFTHVTGMAGRLNVARDSESDEAQGQVELIQDPIGTPPEPDKGPVRLRVTITSKGEDPAAQRDNVNLELSASSFAELRQRYPREVEQYFRPILREFGQDHRIFAVDERVAWQVLGADVEPDPKSAEQVKAVLAQFDSDDFRTREAALGELKKLGQPAALVFARMDRSNLSPEQTAGVDEFLAEYLPLSKEDVARLKASPDFLLDALASEDATLRHLALAQLNHVATTNIDFDPNASPAARAAQLQRLRATIAAGTPTTAPATENPRP